MNMRPDASSLLRGINERLSPRQRQYALLSLILSGGVGLLWLVLASGSSNTPPSRQTSGTPGPVTNIGVMSPGQQVNPLDQWVGTAGSKLAQYESERDEQTRLNRDRQAFEARAMQRFADLEQRLVSASQAQANQAPATGAPTPQVPPLPPMPGPATLPTPAPSASPAFPPAHALPMAPGAPGRLPTGAQALSSPFERPAPTPLLTRVTLVDRSSTSGLAAPGTATPNPRPVEARSVPTFLPVSFTKGTLLGGLDAPTGGQSQSNPHPVLIRLSDNAVLPNRFRGDYRECFVIAAGYGDISSERAYLRTESLSCIRADGAALEVRIQGTVYGEDGKVGMRGRLVTKQGQILANALLAGVVSGIGQGLATANTDVSTSALGTISSMSGSESYRAGLGSGVGRALDRLAQYYIKLAENTFPVIEVDAGREIDVVITKGVRIDTESAASAVAGDGDATQAQAPTVRFTPRATATRSPAQQESSDEHD